MKKHPRVSQLFAALAAAVLAAGTTQAAVVSSGDINLAIPDNGVGLYINFIDGTTFTGPSTFPSLGGPGANYDLNIYGGTTSWTFFAPGSSGQSAPTPVPVTSKGYVSLSSTGAVAALAPGTTIDGSSIFNTGSPSGNGVATGSPVYVGFRFRNEGADLSVATDDTVHFGYALISLPNPTLTQAGTLISYAYESTPGLGITVPTAVPEPGTMALAGVGAVAAAFVARRRRNS